MKFPDVSSSKQMTLIDSGVDPVVLELNKPVSLIHSTNNITNQQRRAFNSICWLAKKQLLKDKNDPLELIEIPWSEFKAIMRLKHRTQKHALEKLAELQHITVGIDILGVDGIVKEKRSLQLIAEVRLSNDVFGDTLIQINLPLTIRERLRESDVTAILNLTEMAKLNSKFSNPLYELCKVALKESDGIRAEFGFDLVEFKMLMDISDGYDRTYDLQKRCIDVAIDEIEEMTDLRITYQLKKIGRGNKVHRVEFLVTKVDANVIEAIEFQKMFNDAIAFVKEGYQEHKQVCQAIDKFLHERGFDYTVSNIKYANIHSKKNYIKFLKDSLDEDYGINDRVQKQQEEKTERSKRDIEAERAQELAEKQAKEDTDLIKLFYTLSEDMKDDVYAEIDAEGVINPFFSRISNEQQIVYVMRRRSENGKQ